MRREAAKMDAELKKKAASMDNELASTMYAMTESKVAIVLYDLINSAGDYPGEAEL